MNISELRPFQKRINITFKVLEKKESKEVISKYDDSKHQVCEVLIGDKTGTMLLTLWDELIDKVQEEKTYSIENGFTSLFKNFIHLNVGRHGTLKESETEIKEVNTENNLSEQEVKIAKRFNK